MTQNSPEDQINYSLNKDGVDKSIHTLINLIPDPAIVFNRDQDKILGANNALYLITQLGQNDFIDKSLDSLFPSAVETDPIIGYGKDSLLRHKNQPLIPVNIKIFNLTDDNNVLLLLLKPSLIKQPTNLSGANQATLIEALTNLVQRKDNLDLKQYFLDLLKEAQNTLNADTVSIYKINEKETQWVRYLAMDNGQNADLPAQIKSEALQVTNEGWLWNGDRPPANSFQRFLVSAGYKYLSVIPLIKDSKIFGVFIAGSKKKTADSNTFNLTKLVAYYIFNLVDDQLNIQSLRNLVNKVKQVVKIQNEIINNLDEGVIILSHDLTVAETNPAVETLLGYANVESLRQPVDSILIGTESLRSALSSAQQGIPTITSGDLKLHHRNGKSFPAQVMMSPVMNKDKLLAVIILIRDISQEEQSQAARKQLEQRAILGEVTAIFAHEVRNPINAIMLSLQVIEDNLQEGDENLKWIENIREECNKLMYLMDSVLSFAKPLEYKMSGVDLNFLLNRILERWHPRFLRLNISSYYESEVDFPVIEGDLRALEQVFTNLISNSTNAMSEKGGSLGIRVSEPELDSDRNFLQITLTDSGHGIPDEIKAHMFKPFVTGSDHGTGLGLAITQRIINAHKGKIEVDSFTGGTIFKIFLMKKKGFTE